MGTALLQPASWSGLQGGCVERVARWPEPEHDPVACPPRTPLSSVKPPCPPCWPRDPQKASRSRTAFWAVGTEVSLRDLPRERWTP